MTAWEEAARAIRDAEAVIVSAGAGMGVDSGLPDYRGNSGFWNNYPMYRDLGIDYQKATRPSAFLRDPGLAWGFYGHCLNLYRSATPHDGFAAILSLASAKPFGYFVFTSNIDGQFQKAGFDTGRLHECHGSIHRLQCIHPCCRRTWPADKVTLAVDVRTMRAMPPFPSCLFCGAIARPNVFAFGDTTFVHEPYTGQSTAFRQWRAGLGGRRTVLIECGAGTTVPGVRRFGEQLCQELDQATLVRINTSDARCDLPRSICLSDHASTALGRIAEVLTKEKNRR